MKLPSRSFRGRIRIVTQEADPIQGCFWTQQWFIAAASVAIAIFVPAALGGGFGVFTAGTLASFSDIAAGGALAGAVSAGLSGGNILKGALFGGIQAAAMAALAPALGADISPMFGKAAGATTAGRFIASGLIGGLTSQIEGGHFASGFLAAGFGALGPAPVQGESWETTITGTIIGATLGGAGSILGGGKFANGAVTGAFAYAATAVADQIKGMGPVTDDPEIKRANCVCDRPLPDQIWTAIAVLRKDLILEGDFSDLAHLSHWDIEYVDKDEGDTYGMTKYKTQVTDIYNGISRLSQEEINFLIAHEFAHLLPANYALYANTLLGQELVNESRNLQPEERQANEFASHVLAMPIPERFAGYGTGRPY